MALVVHEARYGIIGSNQSHTRSSVADSGIANLTIEFFERYRDVGPAHQRTDVLESLIPFFRVAERNRAFWP